MAAPTVTTTPIDLSEVLTTQASVRGDLVATGGTTPVSIWFEWGLTNAYGYSTVPDSVSGAGLFTSGIGSVPNLPALVPHTTYHFHAVAENADGRSDGADQTFTTPDFNYVLSVSIGLQVAIDTPEVNQLGYLVVASRDGGSIKTRDGATWSAAAKDANGSLPGAYLTQFQNRLCVLNKKNAGFAYSDAGDIVADWTNDDAFPNLPLERTGMFEGRDASGGSVLYFLTPRGVYIMDVFSNMTFAPTEVTWERDDTSGKKGLYWKGDNYIAVGKGIYKVSGSEVALVGPDMDDGLPSDLQGTVTDMIGTGFWLVIALDGGQGKKSCILKRYLTGKHWHPVYVGSVNTPIRTLMWDSGTLYFGEGTDVKSLPFPAVTDNVTQLEDHEYAATGSLTYPYFHSQFESMPKIAHKVRAVTRDCNADDKLTIYYRIDEDTAWTTLGSFTTSPRPAVLNFPNTGDSVGVSFERIQLKAEFARGSTTTNSPKLESLILEYRVVPPVLWSWQFRVNAVTQGDVTGKSIIEALKTAIETGTLMSFYPDGDKAGTEYFVEVAAMPGGEKGTDFGQEGLYSVTVQEVTE